MYASAGGGIKPSRSATENVTLGLGFNQAKGELHFMTKEGIVAIAKEAGLNVEWATKEMRTSNELVILTKG